MLCSSASGVLVESNVQIRVPCGHVFSSPRERQYLSLLIHSLDLLFYGVCRPCVHGVAIMAVRAPLLLTCVECYNRDLG